MHGNFRCPICGTWTAIGGCRDPTKCMSEFLARGEELEAIYRREEMAAIRRENSIMRDKIKMLMDNPSLIRWEDL
jgi:hypothetical protein